jgi:glycosyltransferase involved in cell wall biosynthesis
MKVLQINSTVVFGSTGRITNNIGDYLIENGNQSFIAFGRNSGKSNSQLIKIGNKIELLIHLIGSKLLDKHGLFSSFSTKKLINKIKIINPDIIHLHNIHGYYLNYSILFDYLNSTNIPIVWTFHDCWPFTGHCSYYERINCEKWKSQCHNCELLKLYPSSLFVDNSKFNFILKNKKFTQNSNIEIVTVSQWLANQVKLSFFKNNHIQTIYNGMNLNIFKIKEVNKLKDDSKFQGKKIVLGVANEWSEGKGFQKFIEIRKLLSDDYVIVLIGLNQNQLAQLPDGIIGMGRLSSLDLLVNYYNLADVFVTPSLAETFGMVVAESLSCGTPAIVNNSSALPELIDNEVGDICYSNEAFEYVEKIQRITSIGKLHFTAKCREKAENLFDNKNQLNFYYELYNKLLKSK